MKKYCLNLFRPVGLMALAGMCWGVPDAEGAIGDWHVYPAISTYSRIEQLGNRYYLMNGTTLAYTEVGQSVDVQSLTRLDGLNGISVKDIAVNPNLKKLAVVYDDGNIDFINDQGEIRNLPDYANFSIMDDRSIQGIGILADTLYVQTGFGGFLVDMRQEVIQTSLYNKVKQDSAALERWDVVVKAHGNSEALQAILDKLPEEDGTQVHQAAQMAFLHNRLYTVQSTYNNYINSPYGTPAISILNTETDDWHSLPIADLSRQAKALDKNAIFSNFSGIVPDPQDPDRIYLSAYKGSGGIFCIEDDSLVALYNAYLNPDGMTSVNRDENDSVRDARRKTQNTWVGAMQIDDEGYLWFSNGDPETTTTLRCLTPEGKFLKFSTPSFSGYVNGQHSLFGRLRISQHARYPFKWVVRTFHINSAAVCIYYDGGTVEDMSDDQRVVFNSITDQDGNTYAPTFFNDLVEDREGAMWLLTSIGPFVIDDQVYAFNHPGTVRRIKVPRTDGSNLADYLLNEVKCRCMVVDPANRKWIGTDDAGLYLLSADGLTTLAHFTTDNSPLFSNRISGLCMDDEKGVLYVGTNGGLCAYETDVLPEVEDNESVYCYPNPVHPDYTGDLSILGFKDGSTVSVTDAYHHVVFKQKSEGAVIRWNLEGNDGKRIRPGVYFVEAIEEGGKRGGTFKFLVL